MKYSFLHFLMLFIAIAGCTDQSREDMAKISDPAKVSTQPKGSLYAVDTATSIMTWIGKNPTGRHNGIIKFSDGSVTVVKSDSLNQETQEKVSYFIINSGQVTINLETLDILNLKHDREQYDKLLTHLKSEDFFHIDEYPTAFFELTSIEKIRNDTTITEKTEFNIIPPTHSIKGNLTMKGITKGIEFPARVDLRNLKLEASAKFSIDRTVWNINNRDDRDPVAKTKDRLIDPVVNVGFEIIAYSQEP
jgi:hypothetical protein